MQSVRLQGLAWRQKFTTHMGCLMGCLEFLNNRVSWPWLYGATGQAFVLNVHSSLNVNGLTHWDSRMVFDLAPNLGFRVQQVAVGEGYEAWEAARSCLDRGLPCYGLEEGEENAEYFVITGYQPVGPRGIGGYYYSSWDEGGPVPWQARYSGFPGQLRVYCVSPWRPASAEKTVHDALSTVLSYTRGLHTWASGPDFASGLAAYETWAKALETGTALCDGHLSNVITWSECREMAIDFLCEVHEQLPGRCGTALYRAANAYLRVYRLLKRSLDLVPDTIDLFDREAHWQSAEAADVLRRAGAAERKALVALEEALHELTRSSFRMACSSPAGYGRAPGSISLN